MAKDLHDEQLESLIRQMMRDSALSDADLDAAVDPRETWNNIQNAIRRGKSEMPSPWPPAPWYSKLLRIAVPGVAVLSVGIGIFLLSNWARPVEPASSNDQQQMGVRTELVAAVPARAVPEIASVQVAAEKVLEEPNPVTKTVRRSIPKRAAAPAPGKRQEIKSEFIALNYTAMPDSGQVVRVRVPSSMMVTLGLVAHVEKPTSMVDAEVVVGDDGSAHSIRFIR